jgi:hypothetical protein
MKNLIALIFYILLPLLMIILVLHNPWCKAERKPAPKTEKVPVFYTYYVRLNTDRTDYGFYFGDSIWMEVNKYSGDTIRFGTTQKCFLSEHRNLINAKTGEVEYENVAIIREVIEYE